MRAQNSSDGRRQLVVVAQVPDLQAGEGMCMGNLTEISQPVRFAVACCK